MSIAEQLKEERLKKGLSLRKAAELSGVCYTNIDKIERGVVSPTLSVVESLCEVYGVKLVLVPH